MDRHGLWTINKNTKCVFSQRVKFATKKIEVDSKEQKGMRLENKEF